MNNHESGFNPEQQKQERIMELSNLAQKLGFIESEQLLALRRENVGAWYEASQNLVDQIAAKDKDQANYAQLGMMIAQLAIALEQNDYEGFFSDLESVQDMAYGFGRMDVVEALEKLVQE